MTYDVYMAGFGGQGVLMIGNLLGVAAMNEGKNVCYFPAYGVEKRGGAATCTLVISDEEVGSPVVEHPSASLILNPLSMEKYFSKVRKGGFCLINSSLIDDDGSSRPDLELLRIPLSEIAMEIGDARLVNMVCIGAYAQATGAVSLQALKDALSAVLPERNHRFIPMNIQAIDRGAAIAKAAGKGL